MASHGHFHWNELLTGDVERAKKFYAETIGWTLPAAAHGRRRHLLGRTGSATRRSPASSRLNRPGFEDVPERWMSYLAVDDVDARVKKAIAAGAKLMRPIFDVRASAASRS